MERSLISTGSALVRVKDQVLAQTTYRGVLAGVPSFGWEFTCADAAQAEKALDALYQALVDWGYGDDINGQRVHKLIVNGDDKVYKRRISEYTQTLDHKGEDQI
jgi:hypothetical protein